MSIETAETPDAFFDYKMWNVCWRCRFSAFSPRIDEPSLRLLCDISAFSHLVESFRVLRNNLYAATERPLRSLAVMSSVPAEGKCTTTANLAMALAMDGKRVIVVGADMRRPLLH